MKAPTPRMIRCPECYGRVSIAAGDDRESALWFHGLSGQCRARQSAKKEKPPKKERLEALLGEEWG
jgi:hypothetical protein